jgi:Ca-activated chloride channel family protein
MAMVRLGAWARFYPTFLFVIAIAQRALALDCVAVDQQGQPPPDGSVVQVHERADVAVHHQVAATQLTYRFQNKHDVALELTCELRVGPHELIDGFSYWNGSEQVVGEVLERQVASEVYEDLAKVQRRDPGILEQDGDVFRFRVFPLAPGEDKRVELRTVTTLAMRDGLVEYVLPRRNLPLDGGFSLNAEVSDDLPLADVSVNGLPAKLQWLAKNHVKATYDSDSLQGEGDLALRYRVQSDDYALRVVTHREQGNDGTFMLIISPKDKVAGADAIGRDIVFVTDISGSMQGAPLEQAKLGLSDMLAQLGKDDRFEVVSFDDESYPMFGKLVPFDAHSRDDALAKVSKLESNGGTNILGALERAMDMLGETKPGRARAIVFMTDGQGSEPPEVVAARVRERGKGVRIYSVGVGDGVNRPFLERLAEENRGLARFVTGSDQIEEEMKRLYARIAMPLMMDLELTALGGDVHSIYPKQLPDLYRDGEVIVLGRYKRAGAAIFKVRGKLKGGDKLISLAATLPELEPRYPELEKLWAAQRVSQLLQTTGERGEDPELTQEITRLGIVYNLVTPYTTFLAVPAALQTAAIKAQIRAGTRGYDKKLIDSMQGIRLSQAAIPPGDPVLSLQAPADAQQVVAYFPFGLAKRLSWDAFRQRWSVRFLVPRDVADGEYKVRVRIVHADGSQQWTEITYAIDASAPELAVAADELAIPGEQFHITVDPQEPVREVFAYLTAHKQSRVELKLDTETGLYAGDLAIPATLDRDELTIRIVARDLARNRVEQDLKVPMLTAPDCCEDEEETCRL